MNFHTQNPHRTMSSAASSDPSKIHKNSFHCRSDAGELDVFEAARYFSAANDHLPPYINGVREQNRHHLPRRSLDVPIMRSNPILLDQKQPIEDQNKKFKHPYSPGGRLASFLNSLFNQTSLKRKKKSSKSAAKDFEEEIPGGRRKRRSSISHFRITSTAKNAAASLEIGSGFRTPPPYVITPTKSYKELARFADHHQAPVKAVSLEKLRVCEKIKGLNLRKLSEEDDGVESDSSSDLFDLPNHELDFFSSSLPVYATTHMETITIRTPISSAT